ncbi:MAG TPA: hypothetical protein VMI53_08985 [Opitutaceae bacterium]|nr:hypothetical protein [Opitutaceae bacterium]
MNPALRVVARRPGVAILFLASAFLIGSDANAAKPGKTDPDAAAPDATDAKAAKREEKAAARANQDGATNPDTRLLEKLRDRMGVTDDEEWNVISTRIAKVEELRRSLAAGTRALAASGDKIKKSDRGGSSSTPEIDALREAVSDQLPDAEIRARLTRAREAYQRTEAELVKAQADLRSVLTVRQEAMLVMAGILPP